MNFKTTLLLIVLLAAAGVALFYTRGKDAIAPTPTDETNPTSVDTGAKLVDVDAKDVTKIVVTGATPMTLEKTGADWRITAPYPAGAEPFEVDSLLRAITEAHSRGQIDPKGPSGEATGLATPRYTVMLSTPAKTVTIDIGAKSAVGDDLYVRLTGQSTAEVIPTELADKLAKGPDALRKTTLVAATSDQIKQIKITRADGSALSLAKTGPTWQITNPVSAPADDSAASDLVFALTGLRADSFVDPASLPKTALARPQLTVSYGTAAPSTQPASQPASQPAMATVIFGNFEDLLKKNVYVSVSGMNSVAKVPATSLDSFRKTELDVRDKKVVEVDPAMVEKIAIVPEGSAATRSSNVTIDRRHEAVAMGPLMPASMPTTTRAATSRPATAPAVKSKWTVAGAAADDTKVQTLLDALHPLRADKYLPSLAPSTQPAARYVVTITVKGLPSPIVLTLKDPGHDQPVVGTYNGLTFETGRAVLTGLQATFTH